VIRFSTLHSSMNPSFAAAAVLGACLASSSFALQDSPAETAGVTPELLVAHPSLIKGDTLAWRRALAGAVAQDPKGELTPLACRFLGLHESVDMSVSELVQEGGRLRDLSALVGQGPGSLRLRMGIHANARARRFGSSPANLEGDLYEEFLNHWYVVGPLGPLDERMPPAAPAPDLSARFGAQDPGRFSPEPTRADDPGAEQRFADSYLAADGQKHAWLPVERHANQASARWRNDVFPGGGQTYALAFVKTPAGATGATITLEVRTENAVRAWWNGVEAIVEPRVHPLDRIDVLRARVTPHAEGWNAILLRLTTDQRTPLAVRFLNEAGEAIQMEQPPLAVAEMPSWTQGAESTAERLASPLDALPGPLVDGPFAAALRMLHARSMDRYDVALSVPRPEGVPEAEVQAWLRQRLTAVELARHLPEELQRREALSVIEELRSSDAMCAEAFASEIRRLLREDKPTDALEEAEAWIQAAPGLAEPKIARERALNVIDRAGVLSQMALEELLREHPHHARIHMRLAARLAAQDAGAEAIGHAWTALITDASSNDSLDFLLKVFPRTKDARLTDLRTAAAAWEAFHPERAISPGRLAEILSAQGEHEELRDVQLRFAEAHPKLPRAWWTLANTRFMLGDDAGAVDALRHELSLRPYDQTSRELLDRILSQEKAGASSDPAEAFFAEFSPDVGAATALAREKETASVVEALDSGLVYLYPDGTSRGRYQTLTMPMDRSGAEELNAIPVREGTRRIRILKSNGAIQEPAAVNDEWVLPALEPGDVIDQVWDQTRAGTAGTPPDGQLWRFASFERAFPTSRWVLFVPDGLPGRLEILNFNGSHETFEREGGTVHVFSASNPQFIAEPAQPSEIELLPVATFGDDRDRTDELRSWWRYGTASASVPADLELELAQFIETSTEGVEASDVYGRAKALYEAVDEYLQTFQGEEHVAAVWLTKKGWPSFLLAALYERAGVPYEWAALESRVSPELDAPSPLVFDGVRNLAQLVLRLGVNDKAGDPVWILHQGAPGTPFGAVSDSIIGVTAFVMEGSGGQARVETLPRTHAGEHWNLNLQLTYAIQADGSALVSGRTVDPSPQGMMLIKQIREATAEQREGFAKSQAARFTPGVDLEEARVVLDGSEGEGMVLVFRGKAKEFAMPRGNEFVAAIPFIPLQLDRSFGPAERRWPLALRQPVRVRARIRIEPGDGWTLGEMAPSGAEKLEGFEVALEINDDASGVRSYEQRFQQRGLVLAPDEVPGFLVRMGELEQEFRRPLRLMKR
jgi:tetratricopeptide (TPR) repeat protein